MKTYKQLNGVMGDIRDSVYHAYEKIKFLEGERTTEIVPDPSSIGLQFRCRKCNETMVAQYPFCPWCGRIDMFVVENKKYEKENKK